ncbi:MAG TPA: response regulator [Ohtaekwangia sp.]|uniref:response regulator n=1 Tax=Ohtaekwangia sp. TaxID=2066019 RepID=UPI002F953C72
MLQIFQDTMHVLVVDDVQVDRFILKKLLMPSYGVTTLSSSKEAVAFALSHNFDIALLNVTLKEDMDCLELLSDLRSISPVPFKAFATTCHVDRPRYKKLLQSGFESVMLKPFDIDRFHQLVHTHPATAITQ